MRDGSLKEALDELVRRRSVLQDLPEDEAQNVEMSSSEEVELLQVHYDQKLSKSFRGHKDAYDDRTNNLNNMHRLVGRLLKKGY